MKLFMHVAQVFVRHVGVYLRGADVSVAEHGLHGAYVCAVTQQVRREHMAQHVRCYFF